MIPKIIHYCWFGNKTLPEKYVTYINTWKKFFPDYRLICWNENNFPIDKYPYAEQAMKVGKWAFVSDVARIYALAKMGGIYFDTDVEVIRNFDDLLEGEKAVLGTESESECSIGTGFMAFVPEHNICKKMLEYYERNSFLMEDGTFNMIPNTHILADILKSEYSILPKDEIQVAEDLVVYPQEYFTAYDGFIGKSIPTENTKCIHHFAASWSDKKGKVKGWLIKRRNRIVSILRH